MHRFTPILLLTLLTACAGQEHIQEPPPPPAVEVRIQKEYVEVQKPCPVKSPARPGRLPATLPEDAVALAALLGQKLDEYSGPGKWADGMESALRKCTNPAP